jgi:hypothetical protein
MLSGPKGYQLPSGQASLVKHLNNLVATLEVGGAISIVARFGQLN